MGSPTELGQCGDGWGQGRLGNVVVILYRTATPDFGVDHSLELIDRAIARHPSGIVLLAVFEQGAPVPSSGARRRIAQHLALNAGRLRFGATIIEGSNVRSMATRTATAMMMVLLRPPYPHVVVESAAAACPFLLARTVDDGGAALTGEQVVAAVERVRAAAVAAGAQAMAS
jgi:hypothetical protein